MDTVLLQIVINNLVGVFKNAANSDKQQLAAIYVRLRSLCWYSLAIMDYCLQPLRAKSVFSIDCRDEQLDFVEYYKELPNGRRNGLFRRESKIVKGGREIGMYLDGDSPTYVANITTGWRYSDNMRLYVKTSQRYLKCNNDVEIYMAPNNNTSIYLDKDIYWINEVETADNYKLSIITKNIRLWASTKRSRIYEITDCGANGGAMQLVTEMDTCVSETRINEIVAELTKMFGLINCKVEIIWE